MPENPMNNAPATRPGRTNPSGSSVDGATQVLQSAIHQHGCDAVARSKPASDLQRRNEVGSRGRSGPDALQPCRTPRHRDRVDRGNSDDIVPVPWAEQRGPEADPTALDSMGAGRLPAEDRRFGGLHDDAPQPGPAFAQDLGHTQKATGRADVAHPSIEGPVELLDDLGAQCTVADDHVGVIELVGLEAADLEGQLGRPGTHRGNQVGRDALRARDQLDLRPKGQHRSPLLTRECIRADDPQRIALDRADEGQRAAGASARVLDDGLAGLQDSSLTHTSAMPGSTSRVRRTMGVRPIAASAPGRFTYAFRSSTGTMRSPRSAYWPGSGGEGASSMRSVPDWVFG